MIKKVVKKIFPTNRKIGRKLKTIASKIGLAKPWFYNVEYNRWIKYVEPQMFLPVVKTKKQETPLFSIVIPFFNTRERYLTPLLDSIINQSFEDWELIMGDGSSDNERSAAIEASSKEDDRFKYYKFNDNTDISGNTNQSLQKATGKYIVFCDHDDLLSPYALNEIASEIKRDGTIDMVYSDEDKVSDDGFWRHDPFFKPDWSPHLFLNTNYLNHLMVIKRSLVEKEGGLQKEFNGSQDYDLLLRIIRHNKDLNIKHVCKILYHWREAMGSTAAEHTNKSYAVEAGRKALQEFLKESGIKGKTEIIKNRAGYYEQILEPNKIKKVAILVNISSNDLENQLIIENLRVLTNSSVIKVDFVGNLHSKNDYDAIIEIRAVVYPDRPDWLDRLIGVLELSDVYSVSPRIISANKLKVVDMGIIFDNYDHEVELFRGLSIDDATINGDTQLVRDVDKLSEKIVCYKTKVNSTEEYKVVWSTVNFIYYPIFGQHSFFNNNLIVNKKGKVLPREIK